MQLRVLISITGTSTLVVVLVPVVAPESTEKAAANNSRDLRIRARRRVRASPSGTGTAAAGRSAQSILATYEDGGPCAPVDARPPTRPQLARRPLARLCLHRSRAGIALRCRPAGPGSNASSALTYCLWIVGLARGGMASQAGGTLGLVNDLSVKLQKQRKQLNALVKEVKSAADKELTWKHYLGVVVVNNIVVIAAGFVVGMLLYGIGPQEGSFTAGAARPLHSPHLNR